MCKRTRHRVELPVVLLFTLAVSIESACGWGSFAHWQSAPLDPDSGTFLDQSINQPDYWGASVSFTSQRAEVVPLFPWTHGCKRQGGLPIELSVPFCDSLTWTLYWGPWTPTSYGQPAGVRIAEQDMYHLIQRMSALHRSQENLPLMLFMTRGWVGHNTLDAAVHFGVFPGAPVGTTVPGEFVQWAWHGVMEEYIDYWVLMTYVPGAQGTILGHGSLSANLGGSWAHPGLILLGQKAFRKNCASLDTAPPYSGQIETLPVQTLTDITGMIAGQNQDLLLKPYSGQRYYMVRNALLGICPPSGLTGVDYYMLNATARIPPFKDDPASLLAYRQSVLSLYAATLPFVEAACNSMPVPLPPPP